MRNYKLELSQLSNENLEEVLDHTMEVIIHVGGDVEGEISYEDYLDILITECHSRGIDHGIGPRGARHKGSGFAQVPEDKVCPLNDVVDISAMLYGANKGPKGVQ